MSPKESGESEAEPRAARARGDSEALAMAEEAMPGDNEALAIAEGMVNEPKASYRVKRQTGTKNKRR